MGPVDLSKLFNKGQYFQLLALTVDNPAWRAQESTVAHVVGALSFTGRLPEARWLADGPLAQKNPSVRIRTRFFLGLGFTRLSEYDKAATLFAKNLLETRRELPPADLFYVYQGATFYRYYTGQLSSARRLSDVAFQAAFAASDLYAKALATDIRGHILLQTGDTAAGLELLTRAEKLSVRLGNEAVALAIQISQMVYRAAFGIAPELTVKELKSAMENLRPEDNYSRANIALELCRQLSLRGRAREADEILREASTLIYAQQNRRQEASLNLLYAYLQSFSGEAAHALSSIRAAKRALNPKVDRALEKKALGLELKLLTTLRMDTHTRAVSELLAEKSSREAPFIHQRIMARQGFKDFAPAIRPGADPLGDLMDLMKVRPAKAVDLILKEGYYALLYEVLPVRRSRATLYLDLRAGYLLCFSSGEVSVSRGLTPLLRKILNALGEGVTSRADLFRRVWGFDYEALRHDSVIYAAITSLRKLLGPHAGWVLTLENGYAWDARVDLIVHETGDAAAATPKETRDPEDFTRNSTLNFRQLQILRLLKREEFTDVQKCKKIFRISDITASRDLSSLTAAGLVLRQGRGRAIRYRLPPRI